MNALFSKVFNKNSDGEKQKVIEDFLADKIAFEDTTIITIEVKK